MKPKTKIHRQGNKYVWKWLILLCVVVLFGVVVNGPVGEPTDVKGTVEEVCIPLGKPGSSIRCVARLGDDSTAVFSTGFRIDAGTSVSFARYSRRFYGKYYDLKPQ
jgi:hypothetical protein